MRYTKKSSRKCLWSRATAILLALLIVMPVTALAAAPVNYRYEDYEDEQLYEEVAVEAFDIAPVTAPLVAEERTATTPPGVGNQNFEDIATYFPEIWCDQTERTQATFSLESSNLIHEVVWVEVPIDSLSTDNNIQHYERGNRDLVAVRITRPRNADPNHPHTGNEANAEALVRIPALLSASPYRSNNIPALEWVQQMGLNWADGRFAPGGLRYGEATWHPEIPFRSQDLRNNPDTSGLHYADIRWTGLSLFDWPWGDAAHADPFYAIPASRGDRPLAMANRFAGGFGLAGVGPGATAGANFNTFMFTRGFAMIDISMSGARFSFPAGCVVEGPFNTGMGTTGELARMLAGVAVVAWLNGEARAYTCPAANYEVRAYWANGDAIMTGTSYLGTTAYAAVSAGFTRSDDGGYTLNGLPRDGAGGIRALFPVAGIGSWYEYHRRNGAQYRPEVGLMDEAEILGRSTQDIYFSPHFQLGQPDRDAAEHIWVNIVREGSDHGSGDYNTWWDQGNFFRNLQPAVDANIGILTSQGFDDLNVAITNNEPIHWAMQQLGGHHKAIYHLHGHTNVWGWGTGRTIDIAHAWTDYFVFGINGSFQQNFYADHTASGSAVSLFDVAAVVACNVSGDAMFHSQWPPLPLDGNTYQGDHALGTRLDSMRRYYLGQNPTETGGLLLAAPNNAEALPFTDCPRHREVSEPKGQRNPADPFFSANWGVRDGSTGEGRNMQIWNPEAWYTEAWESAMLFPTATPIFRPGTGTQSGFPHAGGVRLHIDIDETEILEHTPYRLSFVSAPLESNVTLAGVPRVTLDIAADHGFGYISAMIVDVGPQPVSRAWVTANQTDYQMPANNILSAWNRWRYNFHPAEATPPYPATPTHPGTPTQAHVVSRSSTDIQNPNPPERPIVLPNGTTIPGRPHGNPGITYINTPVTIHTGMYAPFSWQTTDITPGDFYSYTFTLEPVQYTFREGHRLAVVIYATDMKHLPRTDPAVNFELLLGDGSFIYLPLLTELDIFEDTDVQDAEQFLVDHAEALDLTLAGTSAAVAAFAAAYEYANGDSDADYDYPDDYDYTYGYDYDDGYVNGYDYDGGYVYANQTEPSAMPFATDEYELPHTPAVLPLLPDDALLVEAALTAFAALNPRVQALLAEEKAHLDRLEELLDAHWSAILIVSTFLDAHSDILSHNILTVGWYDNWRMDWHHVGRDGDIIADNNYIHELVDADGILGVVQPNIERIREARADLAALAPVAQQLLSVEAGLLADLYHHALAVEFRAQFQDVLWRTDHHGAADTLRNYQARPHVDGSNYSTVRSRAVAAIAAWENLPPATHDLIGVVRNAAGNSVALAQAGFQLNTIIRLNNVLNRANRASAEIHSLVNIQGRPETFIGGFGQNITAPDEVRIFGPAGNIPQTGPLALTVAQAVPYAQTEITPANINVVNGATVTMFSDVDFTTPTSSVALTPGVVTPVRVAVVGAHGTIHYTLNITRQNNNADLISFAGQPITATAEANPGIYDPIRRENITAIRNAAITVPYSVDAIRGTNAMAIAGINVPTQTVRTTSAGAVARIFAAPETRGGYPDIAEFTREIVGSLYIPLEPGESTPVYVRVRSQASSREAGYLGVNYYRIMVTRTESSTDASLSSLEVVGQVIAPAFDPAVLTYTVTVPNNVTSVTVNAVAAHPGATVTIIGGDDLIVGQNTVTVTVTAEDGTTIETYTITVTRQVPPPPVNGGIGQDPPPPPPPPPPTQPPPTQDRPDDEYDDPQVPLDPPPVFVDVPGHWAREAIEFVHGRGIMLGISDTEFAPDAVLTRAMMATILWRLEGEPSVTFTPVFSDVPAGRWYSQAIVWASEQNIVQGIGGGLFDPHSNITREQFAAMMHRYAVFIGVDTEVPATHSLAQFTDRAQVGAWALGYVLWANYNELLTGVTATTLQPQGNVTRAQCATVLNRFIVRFEEN